MTNGIQLVAAMGACALFAACAGNRAAATMDAPKLSARHQALLESAPEAWPERIAAALPMQLDEANALLAAVRSQPQAPGAPAAVAALGRCGQAVDDAVLVEFVADRGSLAVEAALALGERKPTIALPALHAAVADLAADATLRTAAACALARMGEGKQAAPFLTAVLLAGTPGGAAASARHGLPARPRWALERYLVQRMLLREGATELAHALDPDASWPALEKVTADVEAWLVTR
jgi:hypothetical protein